MRKSYQEFRKGKQSNSSSRLCKLKLTELQQLENELSQLKLRTYPRNELKFPLVEEKKHQSIEKDGYSLSQTCDMTASTSLEYERCCGNGQSFETKETLKHRRHMTNLQGNGTQKNRRKRQETDLKEREDQEKFFPLKSDQKKRTNYKGIMLKQLNKIKDKLHEKIIPMDKVHNILHSLAQLNSLVDHV